MTDVIPPCKQMGHLPNLNTDIVLCVGLFLLTAKAKLIKFFCLCVYFVKEGLVLLVEPD